MKKINILYTGRHQEIMETVVRLINNNDNWSGYGAGSEDETIKLFRKMDFDIVLLGCGISKESEAMLRAAFAQHNQNCKVVQHYGGGSGLLTSEILMALNNVTT